MNRNDGATQWVGARLVVMLTSAVLGTLGGCAGDGDELAAGQALQTAPDTPATAKPAQAPAASSPPPSSADAWSDAHCDAVYELRAHKTDAPDLPFTVAPGATDPVVHIDAPWGSEQVQAIAFKGLVDAKRVLHHFRLYAGVDPLPGDDLLKAWGPGLDSWEVLPPDVGVELPSAPARLHLQPHYYNTTGGPVSDRSGVAVCVVRGKSLRPNVAGVTTRLASFGPIMAPARTSGWESTGTCKVRASAPVTLARVQAYTHRLATAVRSSVTRPDGTKTVLYDISNAGFGEAERRTAVLSPPVVVQTGDVISTTCVYDNPTERIITFGDATDDEACFDFATYYPKGALRCELGQPPDAGQ